MSVERRQTLRVRIHLQVQVSWESTREMVRTHDLSEGGIFVQTSHPCPLGTEVELELEDLRGRPVHLAGAVVWIRQEAEAAGPAGMGIKFRDLDDWDRTLLAELVEIAQSTL